MIILFPLKSLKVEEKFSSLTLNADFNITVDMEKFPKLYGEREL